MLKAADIMTRDVATIRGSATVAEAVELMRQRGWRALIVNRAHDQDAYGMVTEADIVYKVIAPGKDPQQVRVFEIMTKPCISINPDLGVEYVAQLFAEHKLLRAPVIQQQLLGIISVADILLKGNFLEPPPQIQSEQQLQAAITEAETICAQQGILSEACRNAWMRVDQLQVEAAHRRGKKIEKTAFETFCETHPEEIQSQLYDRWCGG